MPPDSGTGSDWVSLADRAALFLRDRGGQAGEEELIAHVFGVERNAAAWRPMLRRVLADPSRFRSLAGEAWSLVEMPSAASPLQDLSFTAVDVEVSGRSPARHRVIEVAAVRVRQGQIVDQFASLVNPQRRLPNYVTTATGITQEMLADAPPFAAVAERCRQFIGTDLLVGVGLHTGLALLRQQLILEGQPALLNQTLDLLALGDLFFPADSGQAPRHPCPNHFGEGRNPDPTPGLFPCREEGIRHSDLHGRHSGEDRNSSPVESISLTDGKRDLSTLAKRLGVQSGRRHRALSDAQTVAKVFLQVLAMARDKGITNLSDLLGGFPDAKRLPAPSSNVQTLNVQTLRDLPEQPGVYVMRDAAGRVLYVGKSKSLRHRVASYFSQPLDYVRNLPGLLEAATTLDVHVVGSDLEAMLLEAKLIRRLSPALNTQQRYKDSLLYVKVDTAVAFPRLTAVREIAPDGAKYFGPFRHSRAAKQAVRWVTSLFPVRSCRRVMVDRRGRRKTSAACLLLGQGRCVGPCQGSVSAEVYERLVDEALEFLAGDKEGAYRRVIAELQAARRRRDFARENELRRMLRQLGKGSVGELLLSANVEAKNVAVVQPSSVPGAVEVFVLCHGRFAGQVRFRLDVPPVRLAERIAITLALSQREGESPPLPERDGWGEGRTAGSDKPCHRRSGSSSPAPILEAGPEDADAVNILTRWIYAHAGEPCIVTLPSRFTGENLQRSVEALLDVATVEVAKREAHIGG